MANLFIYHPQRLWWREWLFQIHLWIGLIATLYVCLIGITGSILVFQNELYRLSCPELFPRIASTPVLPVSRYLEIAAAQFPQVHPTAVYFPNRDRTAIQIEAEARQPRFYNDYLEIYLDPASGRVLGATGRNFWVGWIREFHVRLLAGRTGAIVNGCGAACLLALCITGTVIWWPGVKRWTRALKVDFKRRLRRINFDSHSAIGFWSILFVSMWAISGIYFTWPGPFTAAISLLSPANAANYPQIHVATVEHPRLPDLPKMLAAVQARSSLPLLGIDLPIEPDAPLVIYAGSGNDMDRSSYYFFNPNNANLITTWERGPGNTLGAKFIYWLAPLHFGESFGLVFQIVWCLMGLSIPALSVTGFFMYWNRYLSKRVRRRKPTPIPIEAVAG